MVRIFIRNYFSLIIYIRILYTCFVVDTPSPLCFGCVTHILLLHLLEFIFSTYQICYNVSIFCRFIIFSIEYLKRKVRVLGSVIHTTKCLGKYIRIS